MSAAVPNRCDYIIDDDTDEENDTAQSDMVRVALNLAYMTEEEAETFSFDNKSFSAKMKKAAGSLFSNMLNSKMFWG